MTQKSTIVYTHTDEAPALATQSLLPIVQAFARHADIDVKTADISLSGRILAAFPEYLTEAQRVPTRLPGGRTGETTRCKRNQTAEHQRIRTSTDRRD